MSGSDKGSTDTQFREIVHLSCKHCHYAKQLFIAEVPVCHILVIRDLLRAKYFLRLQAGSVQQSFKPTGRQGLLQVINTLKIYAFFSQDPLDLAALGSCRLLVKDDLGSALHSLSLIALR